MPLVIQRQVPHIQTSWKFVKVPPAKFVGTVMDVPVILQLNQVTKNAEVPQTLYVDKVCRHTCDDGTTGPSVSDCAEDRESPAGTAHERTHVQIADVPVPLAALNKRMSERNTNRSLTCQCLKKSQENVEPGSRDSAACGGATTGSSAFKLWQRRFSPSIKQVTKRAYFPRTQYIDKIVDLPVVMQRMVPRLPTSWKTVEVPPAKLV